MLTRTSGSDSIDITVRLDRNGNREWRDPGTFSSVVFYEGGKWFACPDEYTPAKTFSDELSALDYVLQQPCAKAREDHQAEFEAHQASSGKEE